MRPKHEIRPTDRKMSGQTIALGTIGFLVLASGFFFAGLWGLGPMMKRYLSPRTPAHQALNQPSESAPKNHLKDMSPTSTAGKTDEQGVAVEITEEGEDQQSSSEDQASADSGVKQEDNTLTVTLEPKPEPEKTPPSSPEREKPAVSHAKPPSETPPDVVKRSETSPPASGAYRVQAGTFANKANAENLVQDLKDKGHRAEIKTVQREVGTLYRVELGSFSSRDGAQRVADDLKRQGYAPTVTAER